MAAITEAVLAGRQPATTFRVTYEEFLDRTDDGTHAEWVDGEVLIMSPTSSIHQDLAAEKFIENCTALSDGCGGPPIAPAET